jgi:glutamyl-tRNA reductase
MVVGVRQKRADLHIREQFTFHESEIPTALAALVTYPGIAEAAILSTCNRSEIYVTVQDTEVGLRSLRQFFQKTKGVSLAQHRPAVFTLLHDDVAMHLFRVASGLDSLVFGESQISGQVKDALAMAQKAKTSGVLLDKLFKWALTASKRVRSDLGLSDKDVSVSRQSFTFLQALDPGFLDRPVAVLGGGKMAEIMLGCLDAAVTPQQRQNVRLVNRSQARLDTLCAQYQFEGVGWGRLYEVLDEADTVFVATGAPHLVLDVGDIPPRTRPLSILDIAMPRNVDPAVAEVPHVRLFNLDDLGDTQAQWLGNREQLAAQAQEILLEELTEFRQWHVSLPVVPTLTRWRSKVENIRQKEAACACPVTGTSCSVIDTLTKTLVNKILHDPTVRLKATRNMEAIYQQAAMLSHLFNIEETSVPTHPLPDGHTPAPGANPTSLS